MKRIVALMVCALVLVVANSAEARRSRGGNYYQPTYSQPAYVAPVAQPVAQAKSVPATPVSYSKEEAKSTPVSTVASTAAKTTAAKTTTANPYSTATAQGVANIMAARGYVGHFGGNPGYEGCGMASTPQGAYNICCYANSGMATVDVGYAQGANGMWYCCRRYR